MVKNTPYGKSRTRARRAPSSISGNWNGCSRTFANRVLSSASKWKPRSARSLVSKRRLEDVELGLRRDLDPPHSASAAEAGQKLFADLGPRAGGDLATSMRGEPLGNDVTVPVRHRDLLGVLREVIPQRLNVFELFVGRELVKARRRKCRLRHAASIPSSCWRQAATGGSTDGNPSADCSSS